MSASIILSIPLAIGVALTYLTLLAVGKQVVEKLNGQHFDLAQRLELRDRDVVATRDVQKHTVDKEQEGFNI